MTEKFMLNSLQFKSFIRIEMLTSFTTYFTNDPLEVFQPFTAELHME